MNLLFKWKYFPQALLVLLTASVYSFSASFPLLEGWDDHAYVSCNTERLQPTWDNMLYWFGINLWLAFALYKSGDKQQALKIFEEIKPDLNENSFGSLEGYVAMVKMMVDSCNYIGDSEKAEKFKKEIICR